MPYTESIDVVDELLTLKGLKLLHERNASPAPPLRVVANALRWRAMYCARTWASEVSRWRWSVA